MRAVAVRARRGATTVEYAIILALLAVVMIAMVVPFAQQLKSTFGRADASIAAVNASGATPANSAAAAAAAPAATASAGAAAVADDEHAAKSKHDKHGHANGHDKARKTPPGRKP